MAVIHSKFSITILPILLEHIKKISVYVQKLTNASAGGFCREVERLGAVSRQLG